MKKEVGLRKEGREKGYSCKYKTGRKKGGAELAFAKVPLQGATGTSKSELRSLADPQEGSVGNAASAGRV